MAQYHVGCGLRDIYAWTLKKSGAWCSKSKVTMEAVTAVVQLMYNRIPEGENSFTYGFKMPTGDYVKLRVESSDTYPDWEDNVSRGTA